MPVIRKKTHILRIISADRQTQDLIKHSRLLINAVDHRAIVPGVRAYQVFKVIGYVQRTCRRTARMIIIQRRDRLDLLKLRISGNLLVGVDINIIL